MCGITGMLYPPDRIYPEKDILQDLEVMTDTLAHRGPDDRGVWNDSGSGIYLGQRRLSIIDLSARGRQPMVSASGRFVISYNGEIYNFAELQRGLGKSGVSFRGHSDTEVLLAAIDEWGLEDSLLRSNGMFAFALWDRQEHELILARDRLGIKPLYYGIHKGVFIFGSELKALSASSLFHGEMNKAVIPMYLRYNYVPEPYTIWENTYKLEPGSFLKISAYEWREGKDPDSDNYPGMEKHTYWSARDIALGGSAALPHIGAEEAVDLLEDQLRAAVSDRMVSDVPLGAFLSGGVDSSTIVALMQEQSNRPVKTFSIGFSEEQFNEALYAAEVAKHLGTDHTELYVSPRQAMDVIPSLAQMYDEPYSDYSNIPTYLVSKLAREKVTVSLSGDGGDELFGGYNRHLLIKRLWEKIKRVPSPIRRAGAASLLSLSPEGWDRVFTFLKPIIPNRFRLPDPGYKLHKLSNLLASGNPVELYHGMISEWNYPMSVLKSNKVIDSPLISDPVWNLMNDLTQIIMYLDLVNYLPGDILTKVDRASMAVSLESRVPLLDHRIVELAWKLPQEYKIREGVGKWVLRQVLYRRVPKQLIERPKQGFTVPVGIWLRGPLIEWAEDLLNKKRLDEGNIFNSELVRFLWKEHLSGRRNYDSRLWPILMFEAWRESI